MGAVVRGGLAKGLLASKPAAGYLDHGLEVVQGVQAALATMGESEATPGQNALRYCLAHPGVTTVACGVRTMDQLEEDAGAGRLPPLSTEGLRALRAVAPASVYAAHRTA